MARKKTYIYHVLIGNDNQTDIDIFVLARNMSDGISFLQEKYRDKKYNSYKMIKIGESGLLEETQIISNDKAEKLRKAGMANNTAFREISPKEN